MHAELRAFNDGMVAAMVLDAGAAAARQRRTHAAELGLQPLDSLNDTDSLSLRIAFLNELYEQVGAGCQPGASVAFLFGNRLVIGGHATVSVTTWGAPLAGTSPFAARLATDGRRMLLKLAP